VEPVSDPFLVRQWSDQGPATPLETIRSMHDRILADVGCLPVPTMTWGTGRRDLERRAEKFGFRSRLGRLSFEGKLRIGRAVMR
jgi:hypothetical protein